MIIQAFLRWAETAGAADRAKAARALAKAYFRLLPDDPQKQAALHAMIHLLDDPSSAVRFALSESLAEEPTAPRAVVLALAEDQPDIACPVITLSPVLTDMDLVDIAGRGSSMTRGLIAARPELGRGVAAAIAEIGDTAEAVILLENDSADLSRYVLKRLAERHARSCEVRNLLLDREDLPAEARDVLVREISRALAGSLLVQATLSAPRIAYLTEEAATLATLRLVGNALSDEIPLLVQTMREDGRLTSAFLMHALCSGRIEFFAAAMTDLSGLDDRRVRSIMATGRKHAIRALYESCGLSREISEVFVEATTLWREKLREINSSGEGIFDALVERYPRTVDTYTTINELLDIVESLQRQEYRDMARAYAEQTAYAA
ncbi:DUF2336 domain-containing protein [Rhizobium sp. FKY42]|uniref:DUF2336 domain-containing protein n=1 Tax=Rhizobium sp. FKY42 TaxID=2562310 RepID=UPI0010C0E5D2|nr:DUF2336 domain-containing protein [Rhizobium sp. FKY42]